MVITLSTVIPLGSKSRTSDPTVHSGVDELNNNYNPGNNRGDNNHHVWFRLKQMVWGQYNSYLNLLRRYSRFRFGIQHDNSRQRLLTGNSNESRQPGTRSNGNRKNYRNYCYYYILVCLLAIGVPANAEEGETNNTSNPVAAATGNVTNQAVQFQNNGAPSRQVLGPNISCNGATMTFSPFYMGNHTTPFDDEMNQSSYTVAENWGAQINFMVPLDGSLVERCKSIAARQEAKMQLDYELVRVKNCAELQQKGFMIRPGTRVYHMCQDVIPIAAFKKEVAAAQAAKLPPPPPKPWWQKFNPLNK